MILSVFLGFILIPLIPLLKKISTRHFAKVLSLIPLSLFCYYLAHYDNVINSGFIYEKISWIPAFGIDLSFKLDSLSLIFSLIITGIGFFVYLYASEYLKNEEKLSKFYIYIQIFMSSMLGIVLSDNAIAMFVFWELTSISSFLLIGYHHEQEKSRYAALQALLVTAGGGLSLLAGFILINSISGTFEISEMLIFKNQIITSNLYPAILILFAIGAFTKSAQFPFHFWLPNAMEAPTPVSAYLHSATMVKAGIFLLVKFLPILGATQLWYYIIGIGGAITMIIGASIALKQSDLKKLLAYSTVSVLGALTMMIGIGTKESIAAMYAYLIAHSLYKGALFLCAGIIDHGTGIRDIDKISGLRQYMPIAFSASILAALSGMGIIPLLGFLAKELFYTSVINDTSGLSLIFTLIAVLSSVFMFAVMGYAGVKPYIGELKFPNEKPHESRWYLWIGPALLGLLSIVLGVFPSLVQLDVLISNAVSSQIGSTFAIHLSLWHGFNLALILSIITIALGLLLYLNRNLLLKIMNSIKPINILLPSKWYDWIFNSTLSFAEIQTRIIQNGHLRIYLATIIGMFVVLGGFSFIYYNDPQSVVYALEISYQRFLDHINLFDIIIGLIILTSSAFVLRAEGRLTAIAGLGVSGAMIALLFIINGAPDLAMTQLAIETLTVILFVFVLYKLPRFGRHSTNAERTFDFILALSGGILMSLIIIYVSSYDMISPELREYFAQTSFLQGKGKNIVNVILVDFRGLDTMGEITVLSIAAIGVFSLLRLKNNGGNN